MRRVILTLLSTVTGLVMLLSFKSHPATSLASLPSTATGSGSSSSSSSSGGSSTTPSTATTTAPKTATTKTATGDSIDTRFGPVQVKVTLTGGKITDVTAVAYPDSDPVDQRINSVAIPLLAQEAISANSAEIDMVSGATYTSDAYIQSLQSALNAARG